MAPKSKSAPVDKPIGIEVHLVPDPKLELPYPRLYSNHISIHSSPFDFTLRFCDALPVYEMPKNLQRGILEVKVPIVAEIIVPLEVFPSLINAMQEHLQKHQEALNKLSEGEKKE